ncbi:MAG TPA: Crp/Fnr family transcriptional regulator [Pseudonocardia sp.]|jgi:CRP/FNR family cyclic AMP-dependent transcriptional regulator|uniref:Crp/Fnr family transcriptional regulator n=1 Tax=Pseudonocardia sp. TaxID=60912 RepID=UPI002BF1E143|nr:Crp/Fnr family transcriptional regulator [Pseudonocardia sp.]HTF55338.1 Crp/Fnr family transcriptional regulator [Pseudonocardia sp.]
MATLPTAVVDRAALAAIAASHLRAIPPHLITELAAGAARRRMAPGEVIHREGETRGHFEIVVSGFVRVYVSATDGRTLTVRYCRPGALLGALTLCSEAFVMPVTTQALVGSELLGLRPEVVLRLSDQHPAVSRALLTELSERACSYIAEIRGSAFCSVRERMARHLLDIAAEHQRGSALFVGISQQELAAAVGTVREVVVRILRELRAAGVVETGRRGIVVKDPEQLFELTGMGVELRSLTGPLLAP